ncbi:MAG: hypothetical protein PHV02_07235 [Rhodocyclaceae bacterium]|nr:hypothetical protein [Rhodocyclaceae bacterium]
MADLVHRKVFDSDGTPNLGWLKAPSGTPFVVGGIADAAKGATGAAVGGLLLGAFMPGSARLAEMDHVVLILDKNATAAPKEAMDKMRRDTLEVTRDVLGGENLIIDNAKKSFKYGLTGGACAPGVCVVFPEYLGSKTYLPKIDSQGDYLVTTHYEVYQQGKQYMQGNTKRIVAFARGMGARGYKIGYWDSQNRITYTETGEPCRPMPLPESE